MEVVYRTDKDIPVGKLLDLYRAGKLNSWWTERNARARLDHCYLFLTAWVGEQIVGTVCVLSDGVNDAYIDDVVVHPSFRHQGIGLAMMRKVLKHLEPLKLDFIQLHPIPGREPFFEKAGFKVIPDSCVMEYVHP